MSLETKYRRTLKVGSVLLGLYLVIIFTLPYILTQWHFIDFTKTGNIGDTIGGILGPFIALSGTILTFIAFLAQYQVNIDQKKQFEAQNTESIFFKMIDRLESLIINSNYKINEENIQSYKLLESVVESCRFQMQVKLTLFGRDLLCRKFEMIHDIFFVKMFQIHIKGVSNFYKEIQEFKSYMLELKYDERWDYIIIYFGQNGDENHKQREVLQAIGSTYFYKTSFDLREDMYKTGFYNIEKKYGVFLDAYRRNIELLIRYLESGNHNKSIKDYFNERMSRHERAILFYAAAAGKLNNTTVQYFINNDWLNDLYEHNDMFIDVPSKLELENELNAITAYYNYID